MYMSSLMQRDFAYQLLRPALNASSESEVKKVKITQDNFFTFDNRFLLYGLQVKPGPHIITLEKSATGCPVAPQLS